VSDEQAQEDVKQASMELGLEVTNGTKNQEATMSKYQDAISMVDARHHTGDEEDGMPKYRITSDRFGGRDSVPVTREEFDEMCRQCGWEVPELFRAVDHQTGHEVYLDCGHEVILRRVYDCDMD
jgi:hypothetical protein